MGREPFYEHTDVPPGMTLSEYRRVRAAAPTRTRRARLLVRLRRARRRTS